MSEAAQVAQEAVEQATRDTLPPTAPVEQRLQDLELRNGELVRQMLAMRDLLQS